jgi:2-oxo-4-hydroxy-4-carboxy-5-ureidoimidazoline decarboxylase
MLDSLPFANKDDMLNSADSIWRSLNEDDYLQAFEGHPQIGDVSTLKKKYQSTKSLAAGEQSGVDVASDDVIKQLAEGNKAYLEKFGFIFIVCATGKSAQQMLEMLQARLPNTREQELQNAAEEQRKITRIRLEKLLTN